MKTYVVTSNPFSTLNPCDTLDEALNAARELLEEGRKVVSIAKIQSEQLKGARVVGDLFPAH